MNTISCPYLVYPSKSAIGNAIFFGIHIKQSSHQVNITYVYTLSHLAMRNDCILFVVSIKWAVCMNCISQLNITFVCLLIWWSHLSVQIEFFFSLFQLDVCWKSPNNHNKKTRYNAVENSTTKERKLWNQKRYRSPITRQPIYFSYEKYRLHSTAT